MLVGQQIGPFHVDKELGSGAMGTVYRATYVPNGMIVAIKVMAPGLGTTNSNAAQRFVRESVILKQLKHPNIVRLFAVGKTHGTRYYAMEYIEGETLDQVMARRERMTWEEVVTLGQQLCAALQHAHQMGVIHRDLKPSNLMILRDGTLKLTDFGIAKDMDGTALTSANCTVGTASYMSPEQCRGERDMTHKSDLYSLGVVFYELVTGRKPFNADNAMEMFMQHVSGGFERPSRLVLDLPVWFDNLICQMLEKKPDQRPLDAAMIAQTLNTIQEKVEAQMSAGVDAVRSRRIDRPHGTRNPDEADRDAARSLKDGRRKKKRKGRLPRFYEHAWFMVAGVAGILLAMAVVSYFVFFTANSVDLLYAQSKRLMESNDPAKWDEALDGPLKEFEANHPTAQGDKADQLRRWAVDGHYRQCFEQVKKHLERKHFPPSNPQEEIAFPAAVAENEGKIDKAKDAWKQLQQQAGSGPWGIFAERRLRELDGVDAEKARLQRELEKIRVFRRDPETNDPDLAMLTAFRYERVLDYVEAYQHFEKRKQDFVGKANAHLSYLLAAKKAQELKPMTTGAKDRATLLDDRLRDATEAEDNDAYVIVLDLIALYSDSAEAEVKKRVEKALELRTVLRRKLKLPDTP